MSSHFASVGDTQDKIVSFTEIGAGCYAFTAEGDPNTGVIIGEESVLVVDAQATPAMAEKVIEKIRSVTDKPIKHLVLTHYHAVRALGASAYGASEIIASDLTRRLIEERGEADWKSQHARFPRLFQDADTIPGLTWPTMSFASSMSVNLGQRNVRVMHLGRGHTMGDVVVWVPDVGVMYAGDLVENRTACYCGDAHLGDWPRALNRIGAFRPQALMPGRGEALIGPQSVAEAIEQTGQFLDLLRDTAADCVVEGMGIKDTFQTVKEVMDPLFSGFAIHEHCLPFNVARAYDEAHGLEIPQIWTAERDRDLWDALNGVSVAPAKEPELKATEAATLEEAPLEEPAAEPVVEALSEMSADPAPDDGVSGDKLSADGVANAMLDGSVTVELSQQADGDLGLDEDEIVSGDGNPMEDLDNIQHESETRLVREPENV